MPPTSTARRGAVVAISPLSRLESVKSTGEGHAPPSPFPLFHDAVPRSSLPHEDGHGGRGRERERPDVDTLLNRASQVLDDAPKLRSSKLANALEMQRRRGQRRIENDNASEGGGKASEDHMSSKVLLKTLDEQLGFGGPRVRVSARELEKRPTPQSYMPRQLENNSQYDSEMRANQMARNAGRLRAVEDKLTTLYEKAKHAGRVQIDKKAASYTPDEVMRKLTPADMESVHKAFRALGSKLNLSEFVEVMLAHLPRHDWETQAGLINNVCELYSQLDLDGDGVVTWDEMFEFTIEMGRTTAKAADKLDDVILQYLPKLIENRSEGDGVRQFQDREIERLESLAMMDKIAVLEKDSMVIKLYDAESLQLTACLPGHKGVVLRCMHMEGTDYMVSSGTDSCLIFWGAYTNTQRQLIPCDTVFMSLVWDHENRNLYCGSSTGEVHSFMVPEVDAEDIAITEGIRFQAHGDLVTDMLVIADLGLLVTASLDSKILVWNIATLVGWKSRDLNQELKPRRTLSGHNKGVYSLAYIPSQRYLVSAGYEQSCKVWNPMIEEPLFTMAGHQSMIAGLTVVLGSNRIVTGDVDGVCKVWDLRNFNCVQTVKDERVFDGTVTSITYVSRLDRILVAGIGSRERKVHKMYALDYERPAAPEVADEGPLVRAIYSPINSTVTTASVRTVRVWDATSGLLRKTYGNVTDATITAMCLDGRERRLIIGDEAGVIGIYNILNGTLIQKLESHSADICALGYCSSSKCILSASWAGRVSIHLDSGDKMRILRQIDGHATDITCMVYSIDLGLIGTACTSGALRMWEFQDVKLTASFEAHTTEVTLLAFLDEYRCFISGDFLGNLIIWTISPWKERHVPVVQFEFIVKVPPEDFTRDTPTSAALHAPTHTLYIAGSKGVVNAYDTSALLEALIQWQGVDVTGKQKGKMCPPLPPRQIVRNPREGRSFVPDPRFNRPFSDDILLASGDVTKDVAQYLDWPRDKSGAEMRCKFPNTIVKKRFGWVAHDDSIKSMQLIQEKFDLGSSAAGGEDPEGAATNNASSHNVLEAVCILTASTDQRVRLWGPDGGSLGNLRQGDRTKAKLWKFPVTDEMVRVRRSNDAQQLMMQVI